MAVGPLSGAGSILPFFLHCSESRLVCGLVQRWPVLLKSRHHLYSSRAARLKLDPDTETPDTRGLVAKYYSNRNPRSPELLGVAEKPRGFATWHRRVDYYHRLDTRWSFSASKIML